MNQENSTAFFGESSSIPYVSETISNFFHYITKVEGQIHIKKILFHFLNGTKSILEISKLLDLLWKFFEALMKIHFFSKNKEYSLAGSGKISLNFNQNLRNNFLGKIHYFQ